MNFTALSQLKQRKPADLLILPFFQKDKQAVPSAHFPEFESLYSLPIGAKDFTGKEGEVLILYVNHKQEKRIALLGLGDPKKLTIEILRRAYAAVTTKSIATKLKSINLVLPTLKGFESKEILSGITEGMLLVNYQFSQLKPETIKSSPVSLIQEICFISSIKPAEVLAIAKKHLVICTAIYLARDLVNGNADDVTPQYLAQFAKHLAKTLPHTQAKILTKKELQKEKMGLLLAVGRGSACDPVLITLSYLGNPKSKEHLVLIGKGVTYDTGGLNMKPTGGMETMKCDMGGAATALCTLHAAATLKLPVNLTVVVPSTENAVSANSFKPGDVYISHSGKSVEIGNTDAEGRLILADALSYAVKKLKPTCLIDFATLTGAIDIALGPEASGLFSNDDRLAAQLFEAGQETFERVWRMPLYPEYRENLKSEIADIKNVGGRSAGSILAALFLSEFVGDIPWAHLDIASTAFLSANRRYHPKFATGIGIRLMIYFLERFKR
ncbi:MAG: leucyl aminopeptidase [Parachlamydiaceae bacterium]